MASGRTAAFFDVDKTILASNSGKLFLQELYRRGEINRSTVLSNLVSYLRYKLNRLDIERWAGRTLEGLAGRGVEDLTGGTANFFERRIRPEIYPEAEARVRRHVGLGHVVALVSGSTRFVVEPLAAHLGVEHVVCTELETSKGRLTGGIVKPLCFGAGKIHRLRELIARESIDLARSYFYSDSMSDLPLLELVGYPVVANPDPLLYREARRRRWPIEFYPRP